MNGPGKIALVLLTVALAGAASALALLSSSSSPSRESTPKNAVSLPAPSPSMATRPDPRAPSNQAPSPLASTTIATPPEDPRFPRTVEGTEAIARAFASEPDARERVRLLRELSLRLEVGVVTDARPAVELPASSVDAFYRRALSDPEKNVRLEAIGIISNKGFAAAPGLLEAAIPEERDASVRAAELAGLAQAAGERSVPFLADVLARESSPRERIAVLEAIASAGGNAAADALSKASTDDASPEVRARAKGLSDRLKFSGPPPR